MKQLAERHPPNLARACLALFLAAAVVISGCGGKDTLPPRPTAAPTTAAEPTSAPAAAPTTMPSAVSGDTIPIPSGGFILVPEGALPKDAKVSVAATEMPLLPDDVKPLGKAIAVTASAQPSEPVTLRLPIPAGAADPANLVIIRVEPDGATTFLMTEVEGKELVAATPGFSTFSIGELLLPETQLTMDGPPDMVPTQRASFRLNQASTPDRFGEGTWSTSGGITLIYESAISAVIEAGSTPGYARLDYEALDVVHGRRWFASRGINIVSDSQSGSEQPFKGSLVIWTPVVYSGEQVRFTGQVYGRYDAPITWNLDFGDGAKEEVVTEGATGGRAEFLHRYELSKQSPAYFPRLTATDAKGREAVMSGTVRVSEQRLHVTVDGPQILSWKEGGVSAKYTARASGGEPISQFIWNLPAGKPSRANTFDYDSVTLTFPEPGEYRLEISAEDHAHNKATAFLPIRVKGGEALSTRLLDLPATAKPGAKITFNTQIRGGVLVVSGKKGGYTVVVNWRDGSLPWVEKDVGAARTPDQGTVFPLSHTWTEPKTYEVILMAWDAAGNFAWDAREITITDAAPTASPTAPKTNTPPVAEDITTSTKSGAAVPITLKGADADGDKLTYTFTRPANGSLTGTAPFLTYTPKTGFSGTDTFTYKVRDGKVDSPAATVRISVGGIRWVRDGAPLINATDPKEPLEYYGGGTTPGYFTEARFTGKFTIYRLSETLIAMDDREVDYGKEFWNITYESRFDAPPEVLTPGQVVTLTVKISASGSVAEGMPPTVRFQFGADKAHASIIKPAQPVGYNPWFKENPGVDSGDWTLTVPNGKPGDRFQVWAGWWGCAMCNVAWTYKAE